MNEIADRLSLFNLDWVTLEGGPRECYVIEGVRYLIQCTNYGGFNETWDIEINDGSASAFDSGWKLIATAHDRQNMWVIVDAYLNLLG